MRTPTSLLSLAAVAAMAFTGSAIAGPKTYQVTGPIIAVTDDAITVQKVDEKWEVARSAATKITGDLKVGSKVTITYTMSAVSAEVKDAAKGAADAKGDAPKKDGKKKAK